MRPELQSYRHLASGKVREIYEIDADTLLLVASDRISEFHGELELIAQQDTESIRTPVMLEVSWKFE